MGHRVTGTFRFQGGPTDAIPLAFAGIQILIEFLNTIAVMLTEGGFCARFLDLLCAWHTWKPTQSSSGQGRGKAKCVIRI